MKSRIAILLWVLLSLLVPLRAAADDIDLFVGRSTDGTDPPNVLIILDNSANWGPAAKQIQQMEAMVDVLDELCNPPDGVPITFNLGLMLYSETGSGNSNVQGGYVRSAIRRMDETGCDTYMEMFESLDEGADKSAGSKAGLAMAEAYLYFLGGAGAAEVPYSGNNKNKSDYTGNNFQNATLPCCQASAAVWAQPGNALNSKAATRYNSPVDPEACANNHIIFIGNGPASDSSSDKVTARNMLRNMTGVTTTADITLTGASTNSYNILADEWARFMLNDSPLKIRTYSIDVQIVNNLGQCDATQAKSWSMIMESMATDIPQQQTYFKECTTSFVPGQFAADLLNLFKGILTRDSAFASVALPAAANEQSTFLNQVYIGMFRPDANGLPRWQGNLKQYKIGVEGVSETLRLVDADGAAAVETNPLAKNAGFIKGCARSYWTPTTADSYWNYLLAENVAGKDIKGNDPTQNCLAFPAVSNSPDGQIVEKGGQAYVLRATSPASRNVLTCNPVLATCNANGLVDFIDDVANIPADALGESATPANTTVTPNIPARTKAQDRTNLIDWAIGYDVNLEKTGSAVTNMRPSAHGDIVHSQPVAVNYSGNSNVQEIVVFYGGNDGMVRAVNGNQSTPHAGVGAGAEFWAFMPPEFYLNIKRLRDNTESIQFPASGPTAGQGIAGTPKGYGMDGPLSAYESDTNNDGVSDERTLLAGMRRGGRMIYSFDVTSRTVPELNWKVGCPNMDNDDDCTSGLDDLGQTWSRLSLLYAAGYDGADAGTEPDPLIITGGGYDNCEDYDNGTDKNNNCSVPKGNNIYILDAGTGSVVNSFPTDRSVPGGITVVPVSDDDPKVMFVYAVDTGGNVYRISGGTQSPYAPAIIGSTDPSDWIITKIASLGCDTVAACDANRKFLFGPDVFRVPGSDNLGIVIGSGDREKPLTDYGATNAVDNYFYTIIDQPTNASWLDDSVDAACSGNNLICHNALTTVATGDSFDPDLAISQKGWKLPLRAGEQVVTGAITVDNVVNFSTHIPADPETCDAEYGEATAYNVDYSDAEGSTTEFLGGGLVPTPVAGKVIIDGVPVPFCIGCGAEGSAIGAGKVGGGITWTQPRSRVFWNIDQVED